MAYRPSSPWGAMSRKLEDVRSGPRAISLIYVLVGATWILLSDRILLAMVGNDAARVTALGTYKGWAFVLGSGVMIYQLVLARERARAEMEAHLHDEQARLRSVIQRVPAGLIIADAPSGRILMSNDQVERLLRHPVPPSTVTGRHHESVGFHPDGRRYEAGEWPLARAIRTGEEVSCEEIEILRGDGTRGWFSVSAAPIRDAEGRVTAGVVVFQDVTERRQGEQELARLNAELEARVRARTLELEVMNRELEAFTQTVSHDLRAPLRAISGFTQLLQDDLGASLGEQGRGYLARVSAASERMGQLIDDLLKFSRVARGELARRDTDLSGLATEILGDLRKAEPGREVAIDITPGMRAWADPQLARVALENLLGNAWKYTSRRDRTEITFGRFTRDGEQVFFIRDNGAGFPAARATKLFTPFQRYHSAAEFEGTGVGLATVQRILARHGGRIWAESAVDEGATFFFTLPDEP
jgi:hypothetical protein